MIRPRTLASLCVSTLALSALFGLLHGAPAITAETLSPARPPVFLGGVKLPVAGSQNLSWIGGPVAINSDGSTVVVGAPASVFNGPGAAYVLVRPTVTSNFTQVATLTPSDGADFDGFGASVAISADGSTIVVGRVSTATGTTLGSVAYLFQRPTDGWVNMTERAADSRGTE